MVILNYRKHKLVLLLLSNMRCCVECRVSWAQQKIDVNIVLVHSYNVNSEAWFGVSFQVIAG